VVKSGEVTFFTHKQKKACAKNMVSSNVCLGRKAMKRKTTALRYTLLTAALISLPSLAPAQLLTYEGFGGYNNGQLHLLNGGQGWGSAWAVQNGNTDYPISDASPLTFGTLVTSANNRYLNGAFGWLRVGRTLDTGSGGPWQQANYGVSGAGNINSGTFWFSTLAQISTNATVSIDFSSAGLNTFNPANGNITIRTTGSEWQLGTAGGSFNDIGVTRNDGTTYFVVARFHLNNTASTFHLWVTSDPDSLTLGGPDLDVDTANASLTDLNAASVNFRHLSILANDGGTSNARFDEIRFGKTFADVSPIPEPSTYALLAAGLGALVWLRRRAKAKV
jgi:hypothetical protein